MSLEILDGDYASTSIDRPQDIRENAQRAKIAMGALAICLLLSVGVIISDIAEYNFVNRAVLGNISEGEAEANDQRQLIIGWSLIFTMLLTAIAFIMWMRRAYFNLHIYSREHARFSEGWAAGGWFVPFLNWVRPIQIINDIWDGLQAKMGNTNAVSRGVIPIWWMFWVLMTILGRLYATLIKKVETVEDLYFACYTGFTYDAFLFFGAIAAIMVVHKISQAEQKLDDFWD